MIEFTITNEIWLEQKANYDSIINNTDECESSRSQPIFVAISVAPHRTLPACNTRFVEYTYRGNCRGNSKVRAIPMNSNRLTPPAFHLFMMGVQDFLNQLILKRILLEIETFKYIQSLNNDDFSLDRVL